MQSGAVLTNRIFILAWAFAGFGATILNAAPGGRLG